jgi:hypothetical protein
LLVLDPSSLTDRDTFLGGHCIGNPAICPTGPARCPNLDPPDQLANTGCKDQAACFAAAQKACDDNEK